MRRLVMLAAMLFFANCAHAKTWLTVCNSSDVDLNTVIIFNQNSILATAMGMTAWYADGWVVIKPHACKAVYDTENNSDANLAFTFDKDGKTYSYRGTPEREALHMVNGGELLRARPFEVCVKRGAFHSKKATKEALAQCGPGEARVEAGYKFVSPAGDESDHVTYYDQGKRCEQRFVGSDTAAGRCSRATPLSACTIGARSVRKPCNPSPGAARPEPRRKSGSGTVGSRSDPADHGSG